MRCDLWREALSARLDGEDLDDDLPSAAAVDAHVAACPDCAAWSSAATAVTRLTRIGLTVPPVTVPDGVLDATPRATRARLAGGLRIALGALGAAEMLLGVAQIGGTIGMGLAMSGATAHMVHESAAWNLAVGAAYLFIAWRRSRPTAVLPVLTAFVAVLAVISAGDVAAGAVGAARLLTHLPLLVGYLIVLLMTRPGLAFDRPPGALRHRGRSRWRLFGREPETSGGDVATLPASARRDAPPAARRAA
jgi:predicted anti-sigma-YlaC factor YlaD